MFERTKSIQLSVIKQIELLAARYANVVSLAQGIPSFDTPETIKRRASIALDKGVVAKYSLSPGLPELRELIELSLAKDNMFYDWQSEIIVTAGSIEALTATLLTITMPGDEIIIPDPSYTSYREVIRLSGCEPVYVPLDEKNNWSFDIDSLEKLITPKTKAIFFCNPNNPTGTVYTKEQLLKLADIAEKNNLFIISDEAYKDFIYDDIPYFTLGQVVKYRKRFIRVFSFSKTYAMTGWRVGYVHGDASVIKEIMKVHDCLVTCAPVVSQYAAMGALEMGDEWVGYFKKQYEKRRDLVCEKLDKLADFISYVKPTSAYFVMARYKLNRPSLDLAIDILDKVKLALVPGSAFGPSGENHLRISFGRKEEDIIEGMKRLENYFTSL